MRLRRTFLTSPHLPYQPCDGGLSILYLGNALSARKSGGNLWRRQLRLQKRNVLRQPSKIFCRWKERTTLNFMSATPKRRRIFIRAPLVFKAWPTADRKRALKIARVTPFG